MKWKTILFIIIFLTPLVSDATSKSTELAKIKQLISKLKSSLNIAHKQQSTLQQQLKKTETSAGQTAEKLTQIQRQLTNQQIVLTQLQNNQIRYKAELDTQQKILASQMKAMYMISHQTTLKMALNNEDPTKLNRLFVYYKYLQNARLQLIKQYFLKIQQLYETQHHIKIETSKLASLKSNQQREYDKLLEIKKQRVVLLKNVNNSIKTKEQKLKKYIADEKALTEIIKRLETKSASTPVTFTKSLSESNKKFRWPVNGSLENLFGTSIAHSQLTWNGVLIDAPSGTGVHAISDGKVVFSQWLQGYGLLIIIDHGHGYLSLYGRNDSLYKKAGDIVKEGELISSVGNSGGYENPSLYFAIRYNGKPVNPSLFCG